MTGAVLLALAALLALGALYAAARSPLPTGRTFGGVALMAAALGLAAARQFALAAPVGFFGFSLLRSALAAAHATPQPGRRSEVRSDALEMRLDHDSGEMDGAVLTGRFAGALLSQLSPEELDALAAELEDDPDSLGLLLAYRGRRTGRGSGAGAGGQDAHDAAPPPGGDGSRMGAAEALRILGLEPGASREEVRAAHRRLIRKLHPDLGGSDALAAMINDAKARLDP